MKEPKPNRPDLPDHESTEPEFDFDFDFRPDYWIPWNPLAVIVGNMLGEVRRRTLALSVSKGESASLALTPEDCEDILSEERRAALGSIHSCFTGGEFLPAYSEGEIEIARLVLNTPTLDVISIRVRKDGDQLSYRAVDEFEESNFSHLPYSSDHPLSFGEFVGFVDSISVHGDWAATPFVEQILEYNIAQNVDLDSLHNFLTAESYHYPQMKSYVASRIQAWLDEQMRNRGEVRPWQVDSTGEEDG